MSSVPSLPLFDMPPFRVLGPCVRVGRAGPLAPCTARGRPTGRERAGRARRLSGEEADAAAAALRRRHPFVHRFLVPLELALKRTHNAYYEVELS